MGSRVHPIAFNACKVAMEIFVASAALVLVRLGFTLERKLKLFACHALETSLTQVGGDEEYRVQVQIALLGTSKMGRMLVDAARRALVVCLRG